MDARRQHRINSRYDKSVLRERLDAIRQTLGDLVGVPILPPYYSLRLLPYVVPEINSWKRRLLRERDITDLLG